ncbi:MAG: GNAT family N-acetyltransferase [Candidatus Schekmanbacteria bacterium]|nr:GNAT family N-acetyltransferase [Candidatus Schekmanbacteria bacterium]
MTGTVRTLDVQDYDALVALQQRCGLSSLRLSGRDGRAAFARQMAGGTQVVLGHEVDAALAGAVVVTHDGRKGWINRLVVAPECRRQGVGRDLVAAAEAWLAAQGIRVYAAMIEDSNAASLALFAAAGYARHDRIIYVTKRLCCDD